MWQILETQWLWRFQIDVEFCTMCNPETVEWSKLNHKAISDFNFRHFAKTLMCRKTCHGMSHVKITSIFVASIKFEILYLNFSCKTFQILNKHTQWPQTKLSTFYMRFYIKQMLRSKCFKVLSKIILWHISPWVELRTEPQGWTGARTSDSVFDLHY